MSLYYFFFLFFLENKKWIKKTLDIKWQNLCLYERRIAECSSVQTSESCEIHAFFVLFCKTPIAHIYSCLRTVFNRSTCTFVSQWRSLLHQMHTELGKSHNSLPSFYKHKPTFSTMFSNIMTTVISSQTADGLPGSPSASTVYRTQHWNMGHQNSQTMCSFFLWLPSWRSDRKHQPLFKQAQSIPLALI